MCPSSPDTPECPSCSFPPRMIPAPTPLPTRTTMRSSTPRPAPAARSPQAATERSFPIQSGSLGARACTSLRNGTSRQPRFGAFMTMPVFFWIHPATPRPMPFISPNGRPAAPHAVLAARTTASATWGGSRESSRCFSCPSTWPDASTTAARTLVPPRSTPTKSSSRFTVLSRDGSYQGEGCLRKLLEFVTDFLDRALDQAPDLLQLGLGLRFPAQDQKRLRVGSADEAPGAVDDHAHAVHLDGLAVLAQALFRDLDRAELLLLRKVEADLGRGVHLGHAVEHLGQLAPVARHQLEQARRRVDAVVEAVIAVLEEDVPAHLPREERVLLFHLGLDERVPGLPHDGAAAALLDVVVERLRALHLADDGRAGPVREHVAREEDHQLIAPEDLAVLVHRAHAVGVAVPGDTQIRLCFQHLTLQVVQVLFHGRIGMVIGEGAVELAEELGHVMPQRAQKARSDHAAR